MSSEGRRQMQARISVLLDRDYTRVVPRIHERTDFEAQRANALRWDYADAFVVEGHDCTVSWVKPFLRKPAFGCMGFRWKPHDGEVLDATGYVLPRTDTRIERSFLLKMEVEPQVIDCLGPDPQVFVVTAVARVLRCPVTATDGQNRMMSKDKVLGYICDTLGIVGLTALEKYWHIPVFGG